jgi:hypothetical protein
VINNEGETSKEQQRSTHYFKFVVFMLLFLPSKPLLDYSQKAQDMLIVYWDIKQSFITLLYY